VLDGLAGILSVEEMRKLNDQVDSEKRQAQEVVREFLAQKARGPKPGLARSN
jgi:glycine betaine/choline ABC-type transport system substrate-binding protein